MRPVCGENHPLHKLSEEQVRAIYSAHYDFDISAKRLAKQYNVHQSTIQTIIDGCGWRHLRLKHIPKPHIETGKVIHFPGGRCI
jgi:hypothetical protein